MRQLLARIDEKTEAYARHPLYAFLRDDSLDPLQRLGFVPGLAHFVMTFADLYTLVLRDEPPADRFQEIVNEHTYEDGGHWRWFLADLQKLGHDTPAPLGDALRFVWGDATKNIRMLSYQMFRLGFGASSLQKLVLVHCIEATGRVSLAASAHVVKQVQGPAKNLVYFGPHHFDTEADHTLEDEGVHASLEEHVIAEDQRAGLNQLIDDAFAAFHGFADDLLALASRPRPTPAAVASASA